MKLHFTKMHGLGNDFIVINGINQKVELTPETIKTLSNRHTGIGFDQCLVLKPSIKASADFFYQIYNADGQEVGQCGNGARCIALFAKHYHLINKNSLRVATKTTEMNLHINQNDTVSVSMGIPKRTPSEIPFLVSKQQDQYDLDLKENKRVVIHTINVGNPHAVLIVDNIAQAPVQHLGPQISLHPSFPEQTNVGFMHISNSEEIELRVYERGCGETQACGSGAVAAAAIGRLFYKLSEQITVHLQGGDLMIRWPDMQSEITLTGPAHFIYEGTLIEPD